MKSYTPAERAAFYANTFPEWPAPWTDARWLYAIWALGRNYTGARLHGAYPPNFVKRVLTLFPDAQRVLHCFSGSLVAEPRQVTLDIRPTIPLTDGTVVRPRVCGAAALLPFRPGSFDLCLADPPYSDEDAKKYGTAPVNKRKAFAELYNVIEPGGHLVWLDTVWPMYRKVEWHWWGVINALRSTNHRVRDAFIFQRIGPAAPRTLDLPLFPEE